LNTIERGFSAVAGFRYLLWHKISIMKILVLRTCAVFALFLNFSLCRAQSLPGDAVYTMFRGDALHSGTYQAGQPIDAPHLKWKFKTKGFVHTSPAINGNRVYFGSTDSVMYCLDLRSGAVMWQFKTDGAVNSSPAIAGGLLIFGSHDGNLYALDAITGKQKWVFKTAGEKLFSARHLHGQEPADSLFVDRWDFWLSSPVIANNKIYFGSGSGYMYALDLKTGKQGWAFKTEGIIHSSPAVAYGMVYFGGWDTYMHALDANTGKEIWKFETGVDMDKHNQTGITGSVIVSDSLMYFGCRDSYVYALRATNGTLVWKKYNDHGWVSVTPVIFGNKLIYSSGSSNKFAALDKNTGEVIYQQDIPSGTFASPSVAGNTVYQGTFIGTLMAMDVNTGQIKWTFLTDGAKADKYQILNADLTINDDKIDAANQRAGGKLRPIDFGLSLGCITSSPVIKDGVIYFGSTDGNLYAVD